MYSSSTYESGEHFGNCSNILYFRVKEEVFWRNYFYRVSLIKQSAQLTSLAQQSGDEAETQERKQSKEFYAHSYSSSKWLFPEDRNLKSIQTALKEISARKY